MDSSEFETARVELLSLMADLITGKNILANTTIIEVSIKSLSFKIDNLCSSDYYERVILVEMCLQYYRLKERYQSQ